MKATHDLGNHQNLVPISRPRQHRVPSWCSNTVINLRNCHSYHNYTFQKRGIEDAGFGNRTGGQPVKPPALKLQAKLQAQLKTLVKTLVKNQQAAEVV